MRLLHTSDWHLGRSLYDRRRYDEFEAFLNWLLSIIIEENVDTLLVAGDIFDTPSPANRAQQLYYRFLSQINKTQCEHVVITAGNHDSPSFLDAPGELLKALDVHVVGSASPGNPFNEIKVLLNSPSMRGPVPEGDSLLHEIECGNIIASDVKAVVCAVPYLRDRDIRTMEPGETIDDKNRKMALGLRNHYKEVIQAAETILAALYKTDLDSTQKKIPLIAMGHLFTEKGQTVRGDGVRDLYVGGLVGVDESVFPEVIDYLALGHLHMPQTVGDAAHMRYSGSPIPMGFGESKQQKSVIIVDFENENPKPQVRLLPVPCFQELIQIQGDLIEIQQKIHELKREKSRAWLEIEYTGNEIVPNLRQDIIDEVSDSLMEVRRIQNRMVIERVMTASSSGQSLDDLDEIDVFNRLLDASDFDNDSKDDLIEAFNEVLKNLSEEDNHEDT
ncbi:exonuclease SbcCD subunit D C-terminal domain-containing protein [Myxococcota bacterium]|nr:exonuclease SbcCD subunit D C-terminal domain-containing protein [Myxococcota bacterium]MBU1379579.1 exonuclease SbcCD subunit D C-terminal domain-containing protein [Myxococcota bacterium]MBU1496820.1 exonuclease SbcCD subunit D C-terminal domain-containing protein [Myxococcota bacterium]